MRGIPEFNFPRFYQATGDLRLQGHCVFNPAEQDTAMFGDISAGNDTGSVEQAIRDHGFKLRLALANDCDWICNYADAVCLLPGWANSNGAKAERCLAVALGLKVFNYGDDPPT